MRILPVSVVILLVAAALLTGCSGARGSNVPDEIVVFVDYNGTNVRAVPDSITVTSPRQTIKWFSSTPGLEIEFAKGSKLASVPVNCEGPGRCQMRIPQGNRGTYKYLVRVIDANQKKVEQDPEIIVKY